MMYIHTTTLETKTEADIRGEYSCISFPSPFIPPDGYAPVSPANIPSYDPIMQVLQDAPPAFINGEWVQQLEVVALDADTVTANQTTVMRTKISAIVVAMESLFDTTAQSRRYDNRITCALRAGYVGPFQAEGLAFATWMDACNAIAYQMLAEVQAGAMPMPSTITEALALLPEMVWP